MRQSTESTFLHCLVELIVARQGRRLQRQLARIREASTRH